MHARHCGDVSEVCDNVERTIPQSWENMGREGRTYPVDGVNDGSGGGENGLAPDESGEGRRSTRGGSELCGDDRGADRGGGAVTGVGAGGEAETVEGSSRSGRHLCHQSLDIFEFIVPFICSLHRAISERCPPMPPPLCVVRAGERDDESDWAVKESFWSLKMRIGRRR